MIGVPRYMFKVGCEIHFDLCPARARKPHNAGPPSEDCSINLKRSGTENSIGVIRFPSSALCFFLNRVVAVHTIFSGGYSTALRSPLAAHPT